VLVRLNHSHIRFGSFQRHAYHNDAERLQQLLDFTIENYVPEVAPDMGDDTVLAFLREISRRMGVLAARWTVAGFVHGVLNTDNMNITGESFDYGPWRFLPEYDPSFVAAYFDQSGLYAFGRQPRTLIWNLTRLADAIRPLAPGAALAHALQEFEPAFDAAMRKSLLRRLALRPQGADLDGRLVEAVYAFLKESHIGYDRFFFDNYGGAASEARRAKSPAAALYEGASFQPLRDLFAQYEATHPERLAEPYFQGEAPCSMLIDEVEAIWAPIAERDDWSRFEAKIAEIRAMGALYEDGVGAPP
jgi:uncharacterized protein YdiU (UPF0061 family)